MTARSKVLIRTLPLGDGNYGGILQAYALQRVLTNLGADPITDISRVDAELPLKTHLRELAVATHIAPKTWVERVRHDAAGKDLSAFVSANMHTVRLFDAQPDRINQFCQQVDLFLAGSDQVWRPKYADVPSYMFDFTSRSSSLIASYAASFGTEDLAEYDDQLLERCSNLLARFSAVSVRESSAIGLCKEQMGVAASQHIDPALLLTASQYAEVAPQTGPPVESIATYMLDPEPLISDVIASVGDALKLPVRSLAHGEQASGKAFTVEEWISEFRDARYVITDSFHGTIFAILHKVPFVTISNAERGRARFDSLLDLLGLSSHLLDPQGISVEGTVSRLLSPVDWERVDCVLQLERDRSLSYLADLLARTRPVEPTIAKWKQKTQ